MAEDIPEGVKPTEESSDREEEDTVAPEDKSSLLSRLRIPVPARINSQRSISSLAAAGLVIFILGGFSLSGPLVTSLWPESIVYYKALGFNHTLPGKDIVPDRAEAVVRLDNNREPVLNISGHLLNLSDGQRRIPAIRYEIYRDDRQDPLKTWVSAPQTESIKPESSVKFNEIYQKDLPADATKLQIKLVPAE